MWPIRQSKREAPIEKAISEPTASATPVQANRKNREFQQTSAAFPVLIFSFSSSGRDDGTFLLVAGVGFVQDPTKLELRKAI